MPNRMFVGKNSGENVSALRLMKMGQERWLVVMALTLIGPPGTWAAEESVLFGLTHRSIFGAAFPVDPEYPTLHVTGLLEFGDKGLSVRLGAAASGLYFSRSTRASLSDDNFMTGQNRGTLTSQLHPHRQH